MRNSRAASLLVGPTLAIAVLCTANPAFAEDPTPAPTEAVETAPPADPEESDLIEGGAGEVETPPTEIPPKDPQVPPREPCEPHYLWESTANHKKYHKGVGPTHSNYNGTSRRAKSEFTSEVTGEVGIAASGTLKVKAGAAVAEIEQEYSVQLSVKLTAKTGNKITVGAPPKYINTKYGVYRLKTDDYSQWVYANCIKGVKHSATPYTPNRIGWYIWETH
ncbi:hypothetical protein ACFRLW_38690 [Streptomyces sp. NPDC056728]|uniref:hypothetical protein n=1 Tax=Streptomyces sp. NPDC059916 TaxID=3347001 RepID=UPI0036A19B5E